MKILMPVVLVFCCTTAFMLADNSEVLGDWSCEAVVDMTYPFKLSLSDQDGNLTGYTASDQGSLELESASYVEGVLKFQIDSPEVGVIDFEAKHAESALEGTVGNDMFQGSLSCKRSE